MIIVIPFLVWTGKVEIKVEASSLKEAVVNQVKSGANLRGANLRGADLYGANLRGADLYGANLRGADLYGANLRGANLRGADLRGANLRGEDLYGANLYGANLRGADLRGANLRGADLRGANLRGADLRGADLRGANLRGADLRGANLRGADLYGANLRGANLYGVDDELLAKLVEEGTPYFSMGPIGSRADMLQAFNTDKGLFIQTGCFGPKPLQDFVSAVKKQHGDNQHGKSYLAAIELIKIVMGKEA